MIVEREDKGVHHIIGGPGLEALIEGIGAEIGEEGIHHRQVQGVEVRGGAEGGGAVEEEKTLIVPKVLFNWLIFLCIL